MNQKEKLVEATVLALYGKLTEAEDSEIENFIKQCEDSGKFDDVQMEEIKDGLQEGLTMEQILLYANPKFDEDQMYEIRQGFDDGLTMEQVSTYAKSEYNDKQMKKMRRKLKGIKPANYSSEDIKYMEILHDIDEDTDFVSDTDEAFIRTSNIDGWFEELASWSNMSVNGMLKDLAEYTHSTPSKVKKALEWLYNQYKKDNKFNFNQAYEDISDQLN